MKYDICKIKEHAPRLVGEDQCFKAAVCISLLPVKDQFDILFEVRSGNIPDQPGDICFPGGALESGESYEEAARRETCEELLIRPEQIEILGPSDIMHSGSTIIRPYAGIIRDYRGTFNTGEVAEVFRVPLDFFLETEPERYKMNARVEPGDDFPYDRINGGRNYKWRKRGFTELFYQYDGHVIWGLTARLLFSFCETIRK